MTTVNKGRIPNALRKGGAAAIALLAIALVAFPNAKGFAETAPAIPAPQSAMPQEISKAPQKAVLAGGCFWGVQGVFQHVKGVSNAVSGYTGGKKSTANYEAVSTGTTGHAEAVEITFDPDIVSFGTILQIYFSAVHNPTELNRQGPDRGTQYRSAIFAVNDAQKEVAAAYIAQLDKAGVFGRPVVTRIEPLDGFYPAEEHHQDYATLHPNDGYISYNDLPKIADLKRLFPGVYKEKPALVSMASAKN